MKRESLVLLGGVLVALLPFAGFPGTWKRIGYVALGVLIAFLGYQLRRRAYLRSISTSDGERTTDAYVESPARTGEVEQDADGGRAKKRV